MVTLNRTEVRSSHLRAFELLREPGLTRVALVPEQAILLAGDQVTISVRVGSGQSVEIVEPSGTVAYAMRGARAAWDVSIEIGDGGSLAWRGKPFIVAEGADVVRSTTIEIASAARVELRETLVLGRHHEAPGRLLAHTDVHRDGRPVLVEDLDSGVGVGTHRVLDQCLWLGGATAWSDHSLRLESGDRLDRWMGASVHLSPLGP